MLSSIEIFTSLNIKYKTEDQKGTEGGNLSQIEGEIPKDCIANTDYVV